MRWPLMVFLVVLTLTLLPLDASHNIEEIDSDKKNERDKGMDFKKKVEIKDKKVLDLIEKNLMSLFGFTKIPRPKRKDIVIPQELLELYKKQTGMDVETTNFMLPGRLTSSANTVRSFTHKGNLIQTKFRKAYYCSLNIL